MTFLSYKKDKSTYLDEAPFVSGLMVGGFTTFVIGASAVYSLYGSW